MYCCMKPQGQHRIGFYLWNVVPVILRQNFRGFFPAQCCLEPLGQHCTGFLPVYCYPKSVKAVLNMSFSCAMLPGATRISLHKVVPGVLQHHCKGFFHV